MVEPIEFSETSESTTFSKIKAKKYHKILRFAPTIVLLETILIIILISYLTYFWPSDNRAANNYSPSGQNEFENNNNNQTLDTYLVYKDGLEATTRKFLPTLVTGCTLRKHDLKFGVKCDSKDTTTCNEALKIETFEENNQNNEPKSRKRRRRRRRDIVTISNNNIGPAVTQITTSKVGHRFSVKHVQMKRIECRQEQSPLITTSPLSPIINNNNEKIDCKYKTKLIIDLNQKEQEILGWGGALSDSSINNILSLTTNGTKQLLDDYFGIDGLMFNIIRVTIGGSDFSSRFYTNDDNEMSDSRQAFLSKKSSVLDDNNNNNEEEGLVDSNDDIKLNKFKLREEDVLYKIPILKEIQLNYNKIRDLKFFASMWSPPTWMKTNNYHNKGQIKGFIDSNTKQQLKDEIYYKALANLKKKFVLAYLEEGIKFWGLTILNEPIMARAEFLDFNSLIFPDQDYASYIIKYLGPLFKLDDKLKDLKLIAHDDNRKFLTNFTTPMLKLKEIQQFIDGISTHGYIDEDYYLMKELYDEHHPRDKSFFILPTELSSGHLPWMEKALIGNWDRGIHYALDIIHGLQNSAAGWVDWNMVLDTSGGPGWLGGKLDSPVIVDKLNDSYYKSPMFYILGQFSRYIPPGSSKLKSTIFNTNYDYQFETVSFMSPDEREIITVVLNNNPYNIELNIKLSLVNSSVDLIPSEQYGANGKEILYQVICQADSVTTFIHNKEL